MKRSSEQDFDLFNEDFMVELWGNPKQVRLEGGVSPMCELLCDSFFDPAIDWSNINVNPPQNDFAPLMQAKLPYLSSTSSGHSSHTGSESRSNHVPPGTRELENKPSNTPDAQTNPQSPVRPELVPKTTNGRRKNAKAPLNPPDTAHWPSAPAAGLPCSKEDKPTRGRQGSQNPSASALAQRRYHQRQKAKKQDNQSQLSELTEKMEKLMADKKELEIKNRILLDDLDAWQAHLEAMWGQKGIRDIQQTMTLQASVDLVSRASDADIPIEDALHWSAHEYATVHYERLARYRQKLYGIYKAGGPEACEARRELESLMMQEMDLDRKGGLSSCIHWGFMGYNKAMLEKVKPVPPGEAFWEAVLRELELKDSQVDSILTCYQWMIDMLQRCAEERNEEILPQLGLEATSLPMDKMHQCPAATALYHSYRTEQTAVMGFLLMILKVLDYWQLAVVDCNCYPWSPQWLDLCAILWRRRAQPPLYLPQFGDRQLNLPVQPFMTAVEVLQTPVTMYGIGLRLRHGIIVCPFETVLSRNCFPLPEFGKADKYKLIDIFLGKWRRLTCWAWMAKVRQTGCLIKNEFADGDDWQNSSSCGVFICGQDGQTVNNVPYLLYSANKVHRHPLLHFPSVSSGTDISSSTATRSYSDSRLAVP